MLQHHFKIRQRTVPLSQRGSHFHNLCRRETLSRRQERLCDNRLVQDTVKEFFNSSPIKSFERNEELKAANDRWIKYIWKIPEDYRRQVREVAIVAYPDRRAGTGLYAFVEGGPALSERSLRDYMAGGDGPSSASFAPVTPSGVAYMGRTGLRNLFVNAGHGHLGWTMSCGAGRTVAALVAGEAPEIDISDFPSVPGTPAH